MKKIQFQKIRVRFAPSPTGILHVGNARTALFNYLFARNNKGTFVLRIEDTDIERSKKEYEDDILKNLKWLGINWDEGPDIDGDYGPYRQSEKFEIYQKYFEKLINENNAYPCFCSPEEVEAVRQDQLARGETPHYLGKCRDLDKNTTKKYIEEGRPHVLRFAVSGKKVEFADLIRGKLIFDTSLMGDIIIAKAKFGTDKEKRISYLPLYNFSVVIDDFEMKISHVIRGEDHISNTPKQILLQEALGFSSPQYAHLPLILGRDKSKLSKRNAAVSVAEYKEIGYLPEALVNFIAFLGWNPGDNREVFSLPSLAKEFSLEKIQKGGAVFNIQKLDWLNGFYIRSSSLVSLTKKCVPYLIKNNLIKPAERNQQLIISEEKTDKKPESEREISESDSFEISQSGEIIDFDYIKKAVMIYQERMKKISEIIELTDFFFKKTEYRKELLKWKDMPEKDIKKYLDLSEKILSAVKEENWTKENLEKILLAETQKMAEQGVKDRGYLLWPLRAALTGKQSSAGPFDVAAILGREKTLQRLKEAKNKLR